MPDVAHYSSTESLLKHLKAGLDCGPSILLNSSSKNLPIPELILEELSKHPNFIGVVETAGSEAILSHRKQGILAWSGNDSDLTDNVWSSNTPPGVISSAANMLPGVMNNVVSSWDTSIAKKIEPFCNWLQEDLVDGPTAKSSIVAAHNVSHSLGSLMMLSGVNTPYFRGLYGARGHKDLKRGIELVNKTFNPEEVYGGKINEYIPFHIF